MLSKQQTLTDIAKGGRDIKAITGRLSTDDTHKLALA
jgi:hypothetical protein